MKKITFMLLLVICSFTNKALATDYYTNQTSSITGTTTAVNWTTDTDGSGTTVAYYNPTITSADTFTVIAGTTTINAATTIAGLTIKNGGTVTTSGAVIITVTTLTIESGGKFTKSSTNDFFITGLLTWNGTIKSTSGFIKANGGITGTDGTAKLDPTSTRDVYMFANGNLNLIQASGSSTANGIQLAANATLTGNCVLYGGITFNNTGRTLDLAGFDLQISSIAGAATNLIKGNTASTLTISGANNSSTLYFTSLFQTLKGLNIDNTFSSGSGSVNLNTNLAIGANGLTISSGGTLNIGSSTTVSGATTLNSGGTLNHNSGNLTPNDFTWNGTLKTAGTGFFTVNGNITGTTAIHDPNSIRDIYMTTAGRTIGLTQLSSGYKDSASAARFQIKANVSLSADCKLYTPVFFNANSTLDLNGKNLQVSSIQGGNTSRLIKGNAASNLTISGGVNNSPIYFTVGSETLKGLNIDNAYSTGIGTVTIGSNLNLASGGTSSIAPGKTLITTSTFTLTNAGTITNSGLITNNGTLTNTAGTLANKSRNIFTFTVSAATAASAGATYTDNGITYTVAADKLAGTGTTLVTTGPTTGTIPAGTGTLTFASGTGDASIAWTTVSPTNTTGYLVGNSVSNVTQERYLTSNQRGWRLLSNPLTSTTFGALATSSTTPITLGAGASGAYDSATDTWTSGSDADAMASQQAYKVFVRGRTSEVTTTTYTNPTSPSNATLSITGTANNTAPATVNTTSGQYYLVANPYTAPVSVSSILAASTNLSGTVAYYDPTNASTDLTLKAGGYTTTTPTGAAGSTTDVVLPPMGAIFVQASSAGTINVPTTAIYTGIVTAPAGNYTHKIAQTKEAVASTLKIDVSSNGVHYDALALQFKAVDDAGSNIDFGKLPNTDLDFYSIDADNQKKAVSELELKEQTIPLGITATVSKNYTFKIAENSIPTDYQAVLVDKLKNTTTVLTPGTDYNFAIDGNSTSQGDSRFVINLKTSKALSVDQQELDSKIQLWPNPAHNQFNITNGQNQKDGSSTIEIDTINGQVIHSQKSNPGTTTTIQTNGWATGVYILKATNNGTQTTKKLIIQ